MSIAQYEARQSPALIQHHPPTQHRQPTRHQTLGLASAAMAIVPAAFWASLAWFVWGWLVATIVAIVVLVVSICTMGLVRSANEIETPDPAPRLPETSGVMPSPTANDDASSNRDEGPARARARGADRSLAEQFIAQHHRAGSAARIRVGDVATLEGVPSGALSVASSPAPMPDLVRAGPTKAG